MNERVLIIVGIIAQYFMNEHDFSSEREIVEELLSAGFKEEEINAAFSWMEKVTLQQPPDADQTLLSPPLIRVYAPQERQCLTREARGFLVKLRTAGILTSELEEEIILKACQNDGEVSTLDDVKSITILAMFASLQYDGSREIDCILEDNWNRLYH
ncbi:DUF494 family protein [uncultured Desulfuromonas sp.]|uniref:DUF494 family protein n=1 Tax=uncultured Desulfuromonas sp. TaxID=181013 RepID=UPI002AABCD09|nr:DUF494 family protein [uncultured Desulfuromonas sp.]